MRVQPGTVYLVGAGPGDPGLLTRRGEYVLRHAGVVVYDHLSSERLLDLVPPTAVRIFAGKARGKCPVPQDEINAILAEQARLGRVVARLKGGDPYVFGRGAEEAEHLHAAGIPFEVIPGITAATGVTAYAGIPVTHRDESSAVAFITGHSDPNAPENRLDWPALARFPGTLVFYMGYRFHESICRKLIDLGMASTTPAAMICSGTTAAQCVVSGTLDTLHDEVARHGLGSPALLVIGGVVRRRPDLEWFERLPLFGQRIAITRPENDADRSAEDLEALGAEILVCPTVEIGPPTDPGLLDSAIDRLDSFQWLVFTSGNGVHHFLDRLEARGRDLRALGHLKLAAIGPATADAMRAYHLRADLIPDSYRSEALAEALRDRVRGHRVLLARASRGRSILKDELETVAEVEQVPVYENRDAEALSPRVLHRFEAGTVDWVTVTSSAIANRLHGLLPETARRRLESGEIRVASISPVTSEAVRKLGWPVSAEATEYTWPGLVQAMLAAHGASRQA